MNDDVADLRRRLEQLGRALAAWNATVDKEFQGLWSFNSAPADGFEEALLEAARTAEDRAGAGPREQGYRLLAEVCDVYARAGGPVRVELTGTVRASRDLTVLCLWFGGWACRRLGATSESVWLRRAVTAAVLADTGPDYRDWYLTLGEVWQVAVRRGYDARAAFVAAAAIAPQGREGGAGSTRSMLAGFEGSAFFAETVAPALRRLEAPEGG